MNRKQRQEWLNKHMDSTATIRAMRDGTSPLDVAVWLSSSEAGRILGLSGQRVTQLARAGEIEGVPTSLGWLVDPESVEEYRQERVEELKERAAEMEEGGT